MLTGIPTMFFNQVITSNFSCFHIFVIHQLHFIFIFPHEQLIFHVSLLQSFSHYFEKPSITLKKPSIPFLSAFIITAKITQPAIISVTTPQQLERVMQMGRKTTETNHHKLVGLKT